MRGKLPQLTASPVLQPAVIPSEPRYQDQNRGDRVRPKRSHPRRVVLQELHRVLVEIAGSAQGNQLLDYGCGSCPYRELFEGRFSRYIAADLPGNPAADIDLTEDGRLPLETASVDTVLSSQVLEHVTDPALYLNEAARVLIPRGHLILSTHGVWPYHPDPTDFWRWTSDGLRRIVQLAGFEVVVMRSVLGKLSSAVQLLQDGLRPHVPKCFRSSFVTVTQATIAAIEARKRPAAFSPDGAVFVVVAIKRGGAGVL
jgi:SAM-dependent methyltransferase